MSIDEIYKDKSHTVAAYRPTAKAAPPLRWPGLKRGLEHYSPLERGVPKGRGVFEY